MGIRTPSADRLRILLLVFVVCGCFSITAKEGKVQGGSMKPSNILLPKVELFSIPLGDQSYGLTYEMSDMDVMSDRIPKPLSYDPNNGLYLIDPGSAQASQPILHRFAVDGKRVYQNSLLQALKIQNPVAYLANNLFVDENGDVTLLSSRSYNAELDRNESFILATFNRKGDLSKFVEIPELQQGYPIFRSREGYLWVYNRKDSEGAWSIYNAKGKLERQIKANNNATLLPDGILLVFLDERHAALYDHDGKNYSTIIQGNIIRSDVIVQGRGWFFGLLKYPDDEWKKNPKGDFIFYLDGGLDDWWPGIYFSIVKNFNGGKIQFTIRKNNQKIDKFITTIEKSKKINLKVVNGDKIEIRGFGSFSVKQYGSYTGRNPKTGEKTKVKPKKLPVFKVGKDLREAVDAGRSK